MLRARRVLRLIFTAAVLPLVSACAGYQYTSAFYVRNVLPDAVVTVNASGASEGDRFELQPGEQRPIHIEYTRCPEGYVPVDRYSPYDPMPPASMLGSLEILVDGQLLDDGARLRRNWNRTATEYSEVYILYIDEDLAAQYGGG